MSTESVHGTLSAVGRHRRNKTTDPMCEACTVFWRNYVAQQRRDKLMPVLVPADTVLPHIAVLQEAGFSLRQISEVANVDHSLLSRLVRGQRASLTERSAEALLRVSP